MRVIEFNCRFGDPETQSVLPRLEGGLLDALAASAAGELGGLELRTNGLAAVTVVLASSGYPERGDAGTPIEGIADAEAEGAIVFHAGTAVQNACLVTNGGRVLDVIGTGATVADARAAAYAGVARIDFAGMQFRKDIGA